MYNASQTISECLTSVLEQTYCDIEIIVVDDGSTDNSVELAKEYLQSKNCHYKIISQLNAGPSVARNRGIKEAQGEYIAFLDSDDTWHSDKLKRQIQCFLSDPSLVLLGTAIENHKAYHTEKEFREITLEKLMYHNYFVTSSVVVRKAYLPKVPFNTTQRYSEDYRLWLELVALKYKSGILLAPLTKMANKPMYGAQGLSAKLWLMEKNELRNLLLIYKRGYSSFFKIVPALFFSIIRYIRRCILTGFRNLTNNTRLQSDK